MYSIYPSSFLPSSPASLLLAAVALHAPHRARRLRLYSRPPAFRSTSATTVWFCFVAFFNGVSPPWYSTHTQARAFVTCSTNPSLVFTCMEFRLFKNMCCLVCSRVCVASVLLMCC